MKENLVSGKKISVFSGHDSTIAPLLGAFRIFDDKFPAFGAMMNIEIFKEKSLLGFLGLSGKSYARILYDGKPMILPRCREPGNNYKGQEEFCTLNAFYQAMDDVIQGPSSNSQ